MPHAERLGTTGRGLWFRGRSGLTIVVAAALFLAILVLRSAVQSAQDPVTLLFCLPVALLAVAFGLRPGLLAGLLGVALTAGWVVVEDPDLSLLGWTSTALPMLLLGGLVGAAVDEARRAEDERRRLEAAARRHRDAVELNDSVVQRLSAAKWALESGRPDRGLEIITQTLSEAEQLVTELLRDADMGPTGMRGRPRAREIDRTPGEWIGRGRRTSDSGGSVPGGLG